MVTKIPLLVRSEICHKAAIVIHIVPQGLEENLSALESNLNTVIEKNESIAKKINELNTTVETESVKINVLSKQLTQIDDQKRTIKNLHEAESIFRQLEKEIDYLVNDKKFSFFIVFVCGGKRKGSKLL